MKIPSLGQCLLALVILTVHPLIAGEHLHEAAAEPAEGHGHGADNRVHLNDEQRRLAGIVVETLALQAVPTEIHAPGEIRLNAYASSQVSPRIAAQVTKRHARLGERVSAGQALVTLSSVEMAAAQGELLVAAKEWQRVRILGRKVVSGKRYLQARITYQQAKGRLLAYGLSANQVKQLIASNDISRADGRFTLLSPQNGTLIRDDFIVGQRVEPGALLFELTDESTLWVEARVKPEFIARVTIGAAARVLADKRWIAARVIQIHHALDEGTRTLAVRLAIPNPDDRLHPGQFVEVRIQTDDREATALTLPLDAVVRGADGDWQVFIEEKTGEFVPREVEIVRQLPGRVVIDGLKPGVRVVVQGAFFVQSELAKSGFEIHNH